MCNIQGLEVDRVVTHTLNDAFVILESDQGCLSIAANFPVGVNFMEKKVKIRDASVTFSIWDLGGTF